MGRSRRGRVASSGGASSVVRGGRGRQHGRKRNLYLYLYLYLQVSTRELSNEVLYVYWGRVKLIYA